MSTETAPRRRRPYAARMPADQRREQVLDIALEIAVTHGLREVNMEAIARESGVTKPVIYATFPNAEAVLAALVEREQGRAVEQLFAALPDDVDLADPVAAATVGIAGFLEAVRANPDTWRLLLSADQLPDAARQAHERMRARLVEQISVLADVGLRGRKSGPLDPELTAFLIVQGVEGAIRLVLERPGQFSEGRMVAFLGELVRSVMEG